MKLFRSILGSFREKNDQWRALASRMQQHEKLNIITDSRIIVLSDNDFERLCEKNHIEYGWFDIKRAEYTKWANSIRDFLPENLRAENIGIEHKKLLEFYVSYSLLEFKASDVVLDAAGQKSTYLRLVNKLRPVKRMILQDIALSPLNTDRIESIESDVSHIGLPDGSVSKIAVHHSFEHFRGNSDIEAIREFQRLMSETGVCIIVPIFLSTKYWEVFNADSVTPYDREAEVIVDKFSTFPGWGRGEAFARAYSPEAFEKRIVKNVDRSRFDMKAYKITMEGRSVPNMDINLGTHINYPMRVLQLKSR